jgi:hypothetical protein
MTPRESQPYDPSAVPEWARETIAQIAREHPEHLAHHLGHVAEIEAARRHAAEHPALPMEPDDLLYLAAIQDWQALTSSQPAHDPAVLEAAVHDAFVTRDGTCQVDQLCEAGCTWPASAASSCTTSTATCCPTCLTPSAVPSRRRSSSASPPDT